MERKFREIDSSLIAVRNLIKQYPLEFEYWKYSDIKERVVGRTDGITKHKHGAINHQISGALFGLTLGKMFYETGQLNQNHSIQIGSALLLHDADKPTDMKIINISLENPNTENWNEIKSILLNTKLFGEEEFKKKFSRYRNYFIKDSDPGDRVHIARSIIANALHVKKLKHFGFSDEVINLQGFVEYTGCDKTDKLIDIFENKPQEDKSKIIQKTIVSLTDNCLDNSDIIDPQIRAEKVFKKTINVDLSNAYSKWNDAGETAKEKQIRVSKKQIRFLANLLDIQEEDFIRIVNLNCQNNY